MKKLALTVVAITFGSCVAFAQSAPATDIAETENTVHALTIDRMSNRAEEAEKAERRTISEYALPEAVVEQLKYSELAGHTIISVTEVQPLNSTNKASLQYELVLQDRPAQSDTKSNVAEPRLVVRFDVYGERLSQKEVTAPVLAGKEK